MGERHILFAFHTRPTSVITRQTAAEAAVQHKQEIMLTQYSPSVFRPVRQSGWRQHSSGDRSFVAPSSVSASEASHLCPSHRRASPCPYAPPGLLVRLSENGGDSFQLFVGVFDTCLVWFLLVLPSETHAIVNMTSLRPTDGNTSYHPGESFSLTSLLLHPQTNPWSR